ncbi:MAG: hypothetical protein U9N19_08765, partial [Thermodesulfobacteriota bacterium]|nr:hypothetical protein [Thermodesulfobacteriota bacterium]
KNSPQNGVGIFYSFFENRTLPAGLKTENNERGFRFVVRESGSYSAFLFLNGWKRNERKSANDVSPLGTLENSPAIYCRDKLVIRSPDRDGREEAWSGLKSTMMNGIF